MLKKTILILECSRIFSLPMSILSWMVIFTYSVIDSGNIPYGILSLIEHLITHKGMEALFPSGKVRDSLARPRRIEIAACINRYRKLLFPK